MQVGELALQLDQRMIGAGDIAGAAGAGAHAGGGLDHGADHLGVLGHAEIVVGAPDHDVARAVRRMPQRVREAAGDAFEIGKHPVTAFVPQLSQGGRKKYAVIHVSCSFPPQPTRFLEGFQVVCRGAELSDCK